MKKQTNKLKLVAETIHALKPAELTAVAGGATQKGCQHPTTTVLPTGRC